MVRSTAVRELSTSTSSMNSPSAFVVVDAPVASTTTVASWIGLPLEALMTRPLKVAVPLSSVTSHPATSTTSSSAQDRKKRDRVGMGRSVLGVGVGFGGRNSAAD